MKKYIINKTLDIIDKEYYIVLLLRLFMNKIKMILHFCIILFLLILFISCNIKKEIKYIEIIEQNKEEVRIDENVNTTIDNNLFSFNGIYEIKMASSLLYDKPMEIIETTKIGKKINIKDNTVLFDNNEYLMNSNCMDFPISISENVITQREFCYLWSGMNYGRFDMPIIDPNFNIYILAPDLYIKDREFYDNMPKNVFVRLFENTESKYLVFFINNKLIIDASNADEFQHLKEYYADCFYYIADKI
ncbi:MAG: hypothetical protein LBV17_01695 [Treponema sp.]|nr:hypothetical protein [Treponema sp.]